MKRVAVIGAGSWGTALGIMATRAGHEVRLWSRNTEVVESINRQHLNATYLPDSRIPDGVRATVEIVEALERAELVVLAAPSHATRAILTSMVPVVEPEMIFINATKGIEIETGKITSGMKEVAEGVKTTQALKRLAARLGVKMPITDEVHAVLYEGEKAQVGAANLMTRPLREEF